MQIKRLRTSSHTYLKIFLLSLDHLNFEGKTHKITSSEPFKPGIPKIAILANSPIVPFGINGSYIPFGKLKINLPY